MVVQERLFTRTCRRCYLCAKTHKKGEHGFQKPIVNGFNILACTFMGDCCAYKSDFRSYQTIDATSEESCDF